MRMNQYVHFHQLSCYQICTYALWLHSRDQGVVLQNKKEMTFLLSAEATHPLHQLPSISSYKDFFDTLVCLKLQLNYQPLISKGGFHSVKYLSITNIVSFKNIFYFFYDLPHSFIRTLDFLHLCILFLLFAWDYFSFFALFSHHKSLIFLLFMPNSMLICLKDFLYFIYVLVSSHI